MWCLNIKYNTISILVWEMRYTQTFLMLRKYLKIHLKTLISNLWGSSIKFGQESAILWVKVTTIEKQQKFTAFPTTIFHLSHFAQNDFRFFFFVEFSSCSPDSVFQFQAILCSTNKFSMLFFIRLLNFIIYSYFSLFFIIWCLIEWNLKISLIWLY